MYAGSLLPAAWITNPILSSARVADLLAIRNAAAYQCCTDAKISLSELKRSYIRYSPVYHTTPLLPTYYERIRAVSENISPITFHKYFSEPTLAAKF